MRFSPRFNEPITECEYNRRFSEVEMSTLSRYVLADCDLSGNIGSFFGTFPGAVTVGSFPANGAQRGSSLRLREEQL